MGVAHSYFATSMSHSLPAWWASFSLAMVSLPETLQLAALVPPLRSAECQHCAMQTSVETRAVLSLCRCLCLLQYLHRHRWMQIHTSSGERSSPSIALRQVIQRSGCYQIYAQLHTGFGWRYSWEPVHSGLSHQHFITHVHIGVSSPSPLINVHFRQSFQFCVFIPHIHVITILQREIRKFTSELSVVVQFRWALACGTMR